MGYQGWWPILGRAGSPGYNDAGYRLSAEVENSLRNVERFEIALGAVLTQHTSWKNASKALAGLAAAGLLSAEGIQERSEGELAALIRSCGYHNQKAKKLRLLSGVWGEAVRRSSEPAGLRLQLLGVWGIGPETADSIVLYSFGHPVFVVDAYARRVFSRVGIIDGAEGYDAIQTLVHEKLGRDRDTLSEMHGLLVELGKDFCRTRPLCRECVLRMSCATGRAD